MAPSRPLIGAALAIAAGAPTIAASQDVTLDVRAGLAPSVGRYAEALDGGPIAAVGVRVRVASALGLRLDASRQSLRYLADGHVDALTLGVDRRALALGRGGAPTLTIDLRASAGAAGLRFVPSEGGERWRPTVGAGMRLVLGVTRRAAAFADGGLAATFLGAARAVRSAPTDAGGTLSTMPVTVGLRWTF